MMFCGNLLLILIAIIISTAVDPKFRPSHTGSAPVTMKEDSSMIAMSTNDPQLMAAVQREANAMELESKLKAQKKDQPKVAATQYIQLVFTILRLKGIISPLYIHCFVFGILRSI